jgi:hypothetical protein
MDIKKYRQKLRERAEHNRKAFDGQYSEEITSLLGLSIVEIDQITADTTDIKIYDQLITIVKEASSANIKQAELRTSIMELGEVAVSIANRVPKLAALLA